MHKSLLLALSLSLVAASALAQSAPQATGPLQIQNALSELSRNAPAARSSIGAAATADLVTEVARARAAETAAQSGVTAIASALLPPASYDAFGDSITFGFGVTDLNNAYVPRVGRALGLTPTNHGVPGAMAADQFDWIYPLVPSATGSQLFTYRIGTNDSYFYANDPLRRANFQAFHAAAVAYLAIPNSAKKLLGQSSAITYAGTWSNSSKYGGAIGKQSSVNGSTATFTIYGPTIYLAMTIADGNGGTYSVAVDGTVVGTYAAQGASGSAIVTGAGRTYGSALVRLSGLSTQDHTVVVTVTSATGSGNVVQLDWAGSPVGAYYGSAGPTVVAGGVPRLNGTGLDAQTQPMTVAVQSNISLLASDGLNVAYADVPSYMTPSTDISSDNVHPNDLGAAHVAAAFLAVIAPPATALTKSARVPIAPTLQGVTTLAGAGGNATLTPPRSSRQGHDLSGANGWVVLLLQRQWADQQQQQRGRGAVELRVRSAGAAAHRQWACQRSCLWQQRRPAVW